MPSESTAWRSISKTLKPCPFCGVAPGFYKLGDWFSVRCGTCGLKLEKHQEPEKIVTLWNTRVCNCGMSAQADAFEKQFNAEPAPKKQKHINPNQDDLFEKTFGA